MAIINRDDAAKIVSFGVLAGVAGGIAEMIWMMLWAEFSGTQALQVASAISGAVGITALAPMSSAAVGIVVHMALAIALGIALVLAWRGLAKYWTGSGNLYVLTVAALAGVWAFNFFVLLPLISPAFVQIVPYPVSLLSKLLFGLAAAEILRRGARHDQRQIQGDRLTYRVTG